MAVCLLALADLALVGLIGGALVAVLALGAPRLGRVAVPALGAIAIVAAAFSLGTGRFAVGTPAVTLTPRDFDIWSAVRATASPPTGWCSRR